MFHFLGLKPMVVTHDKELGVQLNQEDFSSYFKIPSKFRLRRLGFSVDLDIR
jgi:hypothetical protein